METTTIASDFAPAERASATQIENDHACIHGFEMISAVLDAMPHIIFLLNEHRQIVFVNRVFLDAFKVDDADGILGLRPGEVIECIHSAETEGGCGTTKYCRQCGAVLAILNSLEGRTETRECRITRKEDYQAFELSVKAAPIRISNRQFTIFSALDISHLKRRRVLERVFFHDIINLAGGVTGLSQLLYETLSYENVESKEWAGLIAASVHEIIEQIRAQKDLSAAESNELSVMVSTLESAEVLKEIAGVCSQHLVAIGRTITIDPSSQTVYFECDATLLKRIMINLVKNSLEASKSGETVTMGCSETGQGVEFWVHNQGVIPDEIQSQLFQRSFSTKGVGRGIGTYSIQLLTEKYLQGSVSFTSNDEQGTIFRVILPRSLK